MAKSEKPAKAEIIKKPVKTMGDNLKQSAWMAILESLAIAILGIFLIAWPDIAIRVIAIVAGVFFIVKGAYQIIFYFMVKGQNNFFNDSLLAGVISVLVGIAALVIGEQLASVFRIVIGIWMVYEALVRMNTAIKLHAAKIDAWKYVLIIAICMLIIGVFITFYNGAVISLIGWMMIVTGIVGIVGDVMFIQYVNDLANALTGGKNKENE